MTEYQTYMLDWLDSQNMRGLSVIMDGRQRVFYPDDIRNDPHNALRLYGIVRKSGFFRARSSDEVL